MKKLSSLLFLFYLLSLGMSAQNVPEWTRDINSLPDSAYLFPVKTVLDDSGFVYVLSAYSKTLIGGNVLNKIYVRKYNDAGTLLWNFVFDNGGNDSPRGFDIVTDVNGNSYVAGGLMTSPTYRPVLIRISAGGNLVWMKDTLTGVTSSQFNTIHIHNNLLYVSEALGIGVFDLNGNEMWTLPVLANAVAIDNSGRFIVSTNDSGNNLFSYSNNGSVVFSDSTVIADRITTDLDNNILLLTDDPEYTLVKYDSTGSFQWLRNTFPARPPFGDFGFEVLTDLNKNVFAVGLSDTMFKFDPVGNLLWMRPMNGMDIYTLSAQITYLHVLAIAGTVYDGTQYDSYVKLYNDIGVVNWEGSYNSNTQQEFPVSLAINNEGIYVLEDSISNSDLLKFKAPIWNDSAISSLFCVDSVWYDDVNPNLIHVSVFNGNIQSVNYPVVHIVSPLGDTISNLSHTFSFFAQMGNSHTEYVDTITVQGIADFSNYTFHMHEGIWDRNFDFGFCTTTGIENIDGSQIVLFPNPASETIFIRNAEGARVDVIDMTGKLVIQQNVSDDLSSIDVSVLVDGAYVVRVVDKKFIRHFRVICD